MSDRSNGNNRFRTISIIAPLVVSGITMAGALIAGVSWGLKLDTIAQQNREELAALRSETRIALVEMRAEIKTLQGVAIRADERLHSEATRIENLINRLQQRLEQPK